MSSSFFNKPKLVETAKYSIIHSDNLKITDQVLGRGSYGTVYAAVLDSKPCVVKEIHPHFNTSEFSDLHKEINTLASLKHPNIVQFFGVYFRSKSTPPILVMERMWTSLSNLLEERPNQLTLLIKTHILYDVACGLQYLHGQKKPVVHRNLKASKILLTENMDAKISDLGQSKALKKIAGQMFSRTLDDLDCMPPEASVEKSVYDSKLDIFSFGCTIIHLVIEQFPTPTARMVLSDNSTNLYVKASETDRRKQFLDLMDTISVLLRQIADQCLQNEPSNRPTAYFLCKRLEEELTSKAKEYKQDKLSLLLSLQKAEVQLGGKEDLGNKMEELLKKKEEFTKLGQEVTKLGQELQELNQNKIRCEEEKTSLQEQLKEVKKHLSTTFSSQEDRLREDVKATEEIIKAADIRLVESKHEIHQLENETSRKFKDKCAEKESLLNKKLEEKDKKFNESHSVIEDSKIKYIDLFQHYEELERHYKTSLEKSLQIELLNRSIVLSLCKKSEELTSNAKQCIQDMLTLEAQLESKKTIIEELILDRSVKDECITQLEQKLQNFRSILDQFKFIFGQEKGILQKEQIIQNEINKKLAATDREYANILRGDAKTKQEIIKAADIKLSELQKEVGDLSQTTSNDGGDCTESILPKMLKHIRLQRDQLHIELKETKKYAEFLKESLVKEEERKMKIIDEFEQAKRDSVKTESTKELQTAWNDLKANIKKFLLIVEGKERTINLPVQLQKISDESAENKSIICKIILDLQEWSLVMQQVQLEWINPLESQLIEKSGNIISLDKELQEKKGKILSNQIKVNQLEEDISNISSQLMIYKKSCDALKIEKRRLIEKSNELKKLEFGDSLIIKSEDVYITPEVLGYGSYSVVYAALYCGKQCVVKRIRPSNEKSHKSLNKELKVLLTLKHPCIIQLLGVFFTSDNPQSPVLLMERMKMNLTETLNIKRSFHFKVSILHDVACGLCYIHKKGIIHCDLTGNNILLTEKCNAKIADFGQAIIYDQEYDKGLPIAPGNEAHMPPESFKPNPVYSTKLDVFSFGCVIIHTVTQEFPIPDNKYVETSEQGKYKELSEVDRRSKQINTLKGNRDGSTILYDMVLECLQDDPHDRPAMEKVCKQLKEIEKLDKSLGHTTLEHCQYIITDIEHDIEKFADNYTVGRASLQVESTRLHIKSETLPPKLLMIEQQLQLTNELQKFKHVPPSIEEETTYIQWLNTRQQQVDITKIFVKRMTVLTNLNVSSCHIGISGTNLIVKSLPSMFSLEEFNISKNVLTDNCVKNLLPALANCLTLRKLNISHNLLTLTGAVNIAHTLRNCSNFQVLDMDNNLTTFLSETEFLVDIILSTNQSLLYLNVCGRNIRPRFVDSYFSPPPNCETYTNRFVLQSLYVSRYMLLNHTSIKRDPVMYMTEEEKCPLYHKKSVALFHVDCTGGTFYNQNHDFAIVIPPGAVSQGDCVQIRATADRFGPFLLPGGHYPVSSFYWINAHYSFKIPVYLMLSHFASALSSEDTDAFCVAEVCDNDTGYSKENVVMKNISGGTYFDFDIGYCVIATNHFCSFCLLSNRMETDRKFLALYYTYDITSPHKAHVAEVCFCPLNSDCIEVIESQYGGKKYNYHFQFLFTEGESLIVSCDESQGWSVYPTGITEIFYEQLDYWKYHDNVKELLKLEKKKVFPPRFKLQYIKINPSITLHSTISVSKRFNDRTFVVGNFPFIKGSEAESAAVLPGPLVDLATRKSMKQRVTLSNEPEMDDLIKIVIPKIKAEWEDVAFALRFKIPAVNAIREKHSGNPKRCCRELFIDWLSTEHGVSPKTWSVLLEKIKGVEELSRVTEEIFEELFIAT